MKFDEKFKQIISEWQNDDYYDDYDDYDYEERPDIGFEYDWEDLQLMPDKNIWVTVTMTAEWNFTPGDSGDYWTEATDDYFEFKRGNEIKNVNVYDEDLDEEFDLTEEEFKEKYPDQYKVFMEKYFNEAPETAPVGRHFAQSLAGKGAAVGAVAKLLFGGPFGLLGNAAIGAAVGMITTSDGFKESILGRMKDGVREGGLIGEIRLAFDPAKQALKKMAKNMLAAFDKGVVDPLSRFAKPFINQLNLAVNFVGNKIAKGFENHIVNPIGNFIGTIFRPFSEAFKFCFQYSIVIEKSGKKM